MAAVSIPTKSSLRQDQLSGFGLKSMQERSEICGGVLTFTPSRTRHFREESPCRSVLPLPVFSGVRLLDTCSLAFNRGKRFVAYWRVLHALGRMHA